MQSEPAPAWVEFRFPLLGAMKNPQEAERQYIALYDEATRRGLQIEEDVDCRTFEHILLVFGWRPEFLASAQPAKALPAPP